MPDEAFDDEDDSVESDSVDDGGNPDYPPSRTRGLMPAWKKGQSGNPSGLTADGRPARGNKVREGIERKLSNPRHRQRFINSWFRDACNGDSKAREQILQRLDPVSHDDQRQGVVVFEGIKLELVARTSATSPAELSETARDVTHTVNPSHPSSESVTHDGIALEQAQESRTLPPPLEESTSPVEESRE